MGMWVVIPIFSLACLFFPFSSSRCAPHSPVKNPGTLNFVNIIFIQVPGGQICQPYVPLPCHGSSYAGRVAIAPMMLECGWGGSGRGRCLGWTQDTQDLFSRSLYRQHLYTARIHRWRWSLCRKKAGQLKLDLRGQWSQMLLARSYWGKGLMIFLPEIRKLWIQTEGVRA